jgi:hypothetical protein
MSPEWVSLEFTEWLARSGCLIFGLSLAWSMIGAHAGRRLAIALTFLTACLSLPWAIHPKDLIHWISLPPSWSPLASPSITPSKIPWARILMGIWVAGSAFLVLRWLLGFWPHAADSDLKYALFQDFSPHPSGRRVAPGFSSPSMPVTGPNPPAVASCSMNWDMSTAEMDG